LVLILRASIHLFIISCTVFYLWNVLNSLLPLYPESVYYQLLIKFLYYINNGWVKYLLVCLNHVKFKSHDQDILREPHFLKARHSRKHSSGASNRAGIHLLSWPGTCECKNGVAYRKFHAKHRNFIKRRKESTFYLYFFSLLVWWSRNIVVGIGSKPGFRRFCIRIAGSSYRFISVPGSPYQLWVPLSLLFNVYRGYYPGSVGRGVKFTNHLHLVLRWRMDGAVLLLHPMRIRGTDRENFTFLPFLYGVALLDITGKFSIRTGRIPNLDFSHYFYYKHKTFSWNPIPILWLYTYSPSSKLTLKLTFRRLTSTIVVVPHR